MTNQWATPGITGGLSAYAPNPPSYWGPGDAEAVAQRLIPSELTGYRSPEMDWADMMRNVGRTWQQRIPLANMQRQYMARYMLGNPGGQPFAQFLSQMPQHTYQMDPSGTMAYQSSGIPVHQAGSGADPFPSLRGRAELAARIAGHTRGEQDEYLLGLGLQSPAYKQAVSLRDYFDPAEGGAANQLEVAQMLQQQRAGGGQWQGRMAGLMRNALANIASARAAEGFPEGTFLDWYLGQTAPPEA